MAAAKTVGVNGSLVYSRMEEELLELYVMLNRNQDAEYIASKVKSFLDHPSPNLEDLAVLLFQTRDIRGGKGEKTLFHTLFWIIHAHCPNVTMSILKLIPEYGSFLDWIKLLDKGRRAMLIDAFEQGNEGLVTDQIRKLIEAQWTQDLSSEKPSLLAKWMPREGKQYDAVAKMIAQDWFPHIEGSRRRMQAYRKAVVERTKALKIVEDNMCNGRWADISFKGVPGRCLRKNAVAFQNVKKNNKEEIRFPDNEDRMACREHYLDFTKQIGEGKVVAHGANVVYPHEIIAKFLGNRWGESTLTTEEAIVLASQFQDMMNKFRGGLLGNSVVMCDVSGSMNGVPIQVCIALGLMCAGLNTGPFKDRIMTFDSQPQWVEVPSDLPLGKKIANVERAPWGMSTNLAAAVKLLMHTLHENKIPIGEEPKYLIIITDMGFDAISGYGQDSFTHIQNIQKKYEYTKWKPPTIVVWNVREEFKQFSNTAWENGVVNLSGWSPSILKLFQHPTLASPMDGFRKILDDERYLPVRLAFREYQNAAKS